MKFSSREDLQKWFETAKTKEKKEYIEKFLLDRKLRKNLVYAPTQVELRSLISPSILTCHRVFGDYYKFCTGLGLKNKHEAFSYEDNDASLCGLAEFPVLKYVNINALKIFVDSREQSPLSLSFPFEIKSLSYGDYAFEDSKIVFERKSAQDFIGSFGVGVDRLENEFDRAFSQGCEQMIVLVEKSLATVLDFRKNKLIPAQSRVTPEFIFHSVREFSQKFPKLQFLFVENRTKAAAIMEKIFLNPEIIKYDLQLAYELKKL